MKLVDAQKQIDEEEQAEQVHFVFTQKGTVKTTAIKNVCIFIKSQPCLKDIFKFNSFTNDIEITKNVNERLGETKFFLQAPYFNDKSIINIRYLAEDMLDVTFSKETITDGVFKVAEENSYNPILDYMNEAYQTYDRKKCILPTFFNDYLGVEKTPASDLITRLFFVGAVAKAFNPSTKFDFCLDLIGSQGIGKTELLKRITPVSQSYYTDSFYSFTDKDDIGRMARCFIVNDDELAVTNNSNFEVIKKFITQNDFIFRKVYDRTDTHRPRNFMIVRTSNNQNYLKDKTGDRRFLPLKCNFKNVKKNIFKDLTTAEVKQLWGEAVTLYRSETVDLSAHSDEEKELLNHQREQFKYVDSVEEQITELLENDFKNDDFISSHDLAMKLTGLPSFTTNRKLANKVHDILVNVFGFRANARQTVGGRKMRGYKKC